jgi:hypothetical protein
MFRQFREAARSCNEWRDTLFCTGLLAIGVLAAEWHWSINASYLLWGVVFRELGRGLAWHSTNPRFAVTALAITSIAMLIRDVALSIELGDLHVVIADNAFSIGSLLAVLPVVIAHSGGVKGAFAAYKATLFDWPRKIAPPRKPTRSRALEKLRDSVRGLAEPAGARRIDHSGQMSPRPQQALAHARLQQRALARR